MAKNSWRNRLGLNVRRQFIAGALVLIPIGIALVILFWAFRSLDNLFQPVVSIFFGRRVIGLGIAATLVLIYLTGVATNNFVGRRAVKIGDWLIRRVPVISDVYTSSRQALEVLSGAQESNLKEVVFVEFPRSGVRAIAFITSEIIDEKGDKAFVILLPHSPNPTSGYLQIVTEDQMTRTDLSVQQAFKMIISGGLVSPVSFSKSQP